MQKSLIIDNNGEVYTLMRSGKQVVRKKLKLNDSASTHSIVLQI